jgi:L-amino acid N-acyltransferase YncA
MNIRNAIRIRDLVESDYPDVRRIYLEGIATGLATFETRAPEWEQWNSSHRFTCRLVAVDEQDVVSGWAALTPVSSRSVYAGIAEVSVYVSQSSRGMGVGKTLLMEILRRSEAEGLWTIQAGIMADNTASIKLHEACGFRMVGFRERIGRLNGVWHNTVLMERRSGII